jgi:transcriptional regulator GlxA family with amidase domain
LSRSVDRAGRESLDLLMIPGGGGTWPLLDEDHHPKEVEALLDWVQAMDGRVKIMASVCTGAAVLARAGLLEGLPAATNHSAFSLVAQRGPKVLWDSVSRWVDSGKYVTRAGVSAGTDMGFYLVSRLAGRAVAENAVTAAEYDWRRDPQAPIFYQKQAVT